MIAKRRRPHRPINLPPEQVDRFHTYYEARRSTECWEWAGPLSTGGYGLFVFRSATHPAAFPMQQGNPMVTYFAHRVSFALAGADPGESVLLHLCNNPKCVNPNHLVAGTQAQNNAHRQLSGKSVRGERQGSAKLTDAAVTSIRREYALGAESQRALARRHGVSQATISRVLLRKNWRHVNGP